jgi:SAM-dependent methyltransferase
MSSPSASNTDQAEFWDTVAPAWIAIEERIEKTALAPGRAAMERLGLQPGDSVVDLGCGTGGTTVELARRVGPEGDALGVDISDEMLEAARLRASSASATNVEFQCADVQSYDFGGRTFDAAFSRFGVMFYADPLAAFTNIRGALKPGGRLAFACWQPVFDNEWMLIPGMATMSVTGVAPPMPAPGEPGPFSLSDAGKTCELLRSAGFTGVEAFAHNDVITVADAEIPEYAQTSLKVGAAREALKDADQATVERAAQAVEKALREHAGGGDVSLTRGYLVVTGSA